MVVFDFVDLSTGEVGVRNVSGSELSIDGYVLRASTDAVVAAPTPLMDGETMTIPSGLTLSFFEDMGLYSPTGGGTPSEIVAYLGWSQEGGPGASTTHRPTAEAAGLWTGFGVALDPMCNQRIVATGDAGTATGFVSCNP